MMLSKLDDISNGKLYCKWGGRWGSCFVVVVLFCFCYFVCLFVCLFVTVVFLQSGRVSCITG